MPKHSTQSRVTKSGSEQVCAKHQGHRVGTTLQPTPAKATDLLHFPLTDTGNAERLVAMYGNEVRYCPEVKKWLVWTGCLWQIDRDGAMGRFSKRTVRTLYAQAASMAASDDQRSIEVHARRSENAGSIRAMQECAKAEKGITVGPTDLDANPWLLNCQNGTLDLQTGELHSPNPQDFITKTCRVDFDPGVLTPHFDAFLSRIFNGSVKLINFVQRVMGYALTGKVTEKALFCLFGEGNNGKTTLLELFRFILGSYAGRS
jgi:putative DNA primase/helicase